MFEIHSMIYAKNRQKNFYIQNFLKKILMIIDLIEIKMKSTKQ